MRKDCVVSKIMCPKVLFSVSFVCLFAAGCAGTAKQVNIVSACEYSSGIWQNDRCICQTETCQAGIVCSTLTRTCANHALPDNQEQPKIAQIPAEEALSLWQPDAESKKALISYMEMITTPGKDFVPAEDRLAVFDLDGTLLCETDPNYLDYNLYVYRVLEDPTYKDKATPKQIEVANKIVQVNETGTVPDGLDVEHQIAYMEVFAGMTIPEFTRYVRHFIDQPAPGYDGMKRGQAYYKPMLEVIKYLQANAFTVYIVSGTDRLQVRAASASILNIPEYQIIGSDGTIVASGQTKTDNLNDDNLHYVYKTDDKLIRGGGFIVKNLKMNKVAVIAQEIGKQPILSFGNSTGDASMAEYVISNNPHPSRAFMLLADDLERENGNQAKADKMSKMCEENGWIPISMKNDWTTIYGDGVTRKK